MFYSIPHRAGSLRVKSISNRYRFVFGFFGALGLSFFLALLPVSAGVATSPAEISDPRVLGSWVADTANLISAEGETTLNQMIDELEAKNGSEIMVVTVAETQPSPSPKAFATDLFNHWGIGKADVNNGVLFLVSTGARRAEIDVGYGLEDIMTQRQAEQLLAEDVLPEFKQEQFESGILQGTERLVAIVGKEVSAPAIAPSISGEDLQFFLSAFVVLVMFVWGVYDRIRNGGSNRNHYHNSHDSGYSSHHSSSNGDSGGGSSGGGGGGGSW